ncbi:hypothetical protein RPB_3313 [Rhodopseudomonas palustris HaA2]|uniref:Uncharacterized protein n=1 Tax=Rhodopseudomonas palustris (strain HaA2) TaxID=316058 RepID=Q2IUV1_RHOP2|nr:hypothetical protein [Rhodopseudomonas palustris]ABD08009.1 hypothetical protein RPB_3313 [Rhodopseudomonas palustris HaA2]
MTREERFADLKAATSQLAAARRSLADQQFNARHGVAHNLMFATSHEHVAYHRWLRAHEALAATEPKPPVVAPKAPITASAPAPQAAAPKVETTFDRGREAVAAYYRGEFEPLR